MHLALLYKQNHNRCHLQKSFRINMLVSLFSIAPVQSVIFSNFNKSHTIIYKHYRKIIYLTTCIAITNYLIYFSSKPTTYAVLSGYQTCCNLRGFFLHPLNLVKMYGFLPFHPFKTRFWSFFIYLQGSTRPWPLNFP